MADTSLADALRAFRDAVDGLPKRVSDALADALRSAAQATGGATGPATSGQGPTSPRSPAAALASAFYGPGGVNLLLRQIGLGRLVYEALRLAKAFAAMSDATGAGRPGGLPRGGGAVAAARRAAGAARTSGAARPGPG